MRDDARADIGKDLNAAADELKAALVRPKPLLLFESVRSEGESTLRLIWNPGRDSSESHLLLSLVPSNVRFTIGNADLGRFRHFLLAALRQMKETVLGGDEASARTQPIGLADSDGYEAVAVYLDESWRVRLSNSEADESGVLLEASELAGVASLLAKFDPDNPSRSSLDSREFNGPEIQAAPASNSSGKVQRGGPPIIPSRSLLPEFGEVPGDKPVPAPISPAGPEPQPREGIATARTNAWAIVGLVFGLVSILFWEIGGIPLMAVVASSIGLASIGKCGGKGKVSSSIGLVLGVLYTIVSLNAYYNSA